MNNNELTTIEKVKCLKQIGKGSFSNVYLFENKEFFESSIGYESLLFNVNLDKTYNAKNIKHNQYFIIKEIDLSKLVYKYLYKKQKKIFKPFKIKSVLKILPPKNDELNDSTTGININPKKSNHQVWNTASVNITPFSHNQIDIKVKMTEEDYYHDKLKELIESEIIILKHLSHLNIINYFDSTVLNDVYSIKMEFCDLGDLYSILKEKNHFKEINQKDKYNLKTYRNKVNGFNIKFVKQFLIDIVNGLKYIHDNNLIHRDIKLQNFLVNKLNTEDNNFGFIFKISDFGFSCYDLSNKISYKNNFIDDDSIKKKYYKLCGTPYYMAPEMLINLEKFDQLLPSNCSSGSDIENNTSKNNLYTKKIDLWSFGICLYELLFNILPFANMNDMNDLKVFYSNKSTQAIIFKNIQDKLTISDEMKNILKKLLTIDPNNRISTNELLVLVNNLSNTEINSNHINSTINNKVVSVNMESWLIEEFTKSNLEENWDKIDKNVIDTNFNNLTSSIDHNFIQWLGLKKN